MAETFCYSNPTDTLPLCEKLTLESRFPRVEHKTLRVSFNEGFSHQAPDGGINTKREEFDINWINLTLAEKQALEASLDTYGGWSPYTWTINQSGPTRKLIVKDGKYSVTERLGTFQVSCTLEKVFDL
jgi:phage-related protein